MAKKVAVQRETTDIISVDNLKNAIAKNNFVDLDQELIDKIQTQVDTVLQHQSHNERTARETIEKWFSKQLLKNRDFDIKNLRLTVDNQPIIYIQSQYHCETRQFSRVHEPYRGQTVPDKAEELWEKEPQNPFTTSDIKWKRFGNNEVKNCHTCSAKGQVTCSECKGQGEVWVTCGNCKGKGQIERTDAIVGRGGGKMAGGVVLRKEQCLRCSAKGKVLVTCKKCNGSGKLTCGTCSGRKELFYYDNIQGKTSIVSKDLVLSTFDTANDKWIKNNKSAFNIQYKDKIHGQNENRLKDQIPPNGKLLLEQYNVKILPTSKIDFNFKNKEREIFIIDNEVFTNETAYLYDKKKTSMAIAIGVLAIFILSFLGYYWYSTNKANNIKEQNKLAQSLASETRTLISQEKYSEAANKLAAFNISFGDYEQSSKDSINSAVYLFLSENLGSRETEKIYNSYASLYFIDNTNKELLSISHSVALINKYLADIDGKRSQKTENSYYEQKKWEEIASLNVKVDSLLSPLLENEAIKDFIHAETVSSSIHKDFESYLSQLLSFEKTKEGTPCSIDTDLKKFENFTLQLKSKSLLKLLEPAIKKLKVALKKYENVC